MATELFYIGRRGARAAKTRVILAQGAMLIFYASFLRLVYALRKLPESNDSEMGLANLLHVSAQYSEYNERFDFDLIFREQKFLPSRFCDKSLEKNSFYFKSTCF